MLALHMKHSGPSAEPPAGTDEFGMAEDDAAEVRTQWPPELLMCESPYILCNGMTNAGMLTGLFFQNSMIEKQHAEVI